MSQNWPKLPYEWAHSLNDAYDELKALKEILNKRLRN